MWSEPLDVGISLVLELDNGGNSGRGGGKGAREEGQTRDHFVPLCKPVKVSVLPKPVRRGI